MLSKLKTRTDLFRFVEFESIEAKRDGFLISGENLELIEKKWLEAFTEDVDWHHPNEFMDYINCYFESRSEAGLIINVLIDRSQRFHTIKKLIPKSQVLCAFVPFAMESHHYTVVKKESFDSIKSSLYSTYAIIDFIGVRSIISEHGFFPSDIMNQVKHEVEKFAEIHPNYYFLTCADNVIIKTNWIVNGVENSFSPEHFILTINNLIKQIHRSTQIPSYAIISQGANYVNENEINNVPASSNHFFLPSISVPFIEAFEIDKDARHKIRSKQLSKCELYLEYSFYTSLHRKFFSGEEPSWFKIQTINKSNQFSHLKYIALNQSQLEEVVDLNK